MNSIKLQLPADRMPYVQLRNTITLMVLILIARFDHNWVDNIVSTIELQSRTIFKSRDFGIGKRQFRDPGIQSGDGEFETVCKPCAFAGYIVRLTIACEYARFAEVRANYNNVFRCYIFVSLIIVAYI
jgi:hypothetical protein